MRLNPCPKLAFQRSVLIFEFNITRRMEHTFASHLKMDISDLLGDDFYWHSNMHFLLVTASNFLEGFGGTKLFPDETWALLLRLILATKSMGYFCL